MDEAPTECPRHGHHVPCMICGSWSPPEEHPTAHTARQPLISFVPASPPGSAVDKS
jgi:hypothetical protein